MSGRRSGSKSHTRGCKSRAAAIEAAALEELGHDRGLGGRRAPNTRTGEKYGWGRNGAVRLEDPPQDIDEASHATTAGMARSRLGMGMGMGGEWIGGMGVMGGFGPGLGPFGGMSNMDGRNPRMGMNRPASPRGPFRKGGQPFGDEAMQVMPQSPFLRPGMEGMRPPEGYMPAREAFMYRPPPGMGSPRASLRFNASSDMLAMDRQRMPYGPMQNHHFQNLYQNYRPPYVEDYEGSEYDAEMAQQAMARMYPYAATPFLFDDPYGGEFGEMGGVGQMGGMNPQVGAHPMAGMGRVNGGGIGEMGGMGGMCQF